MDKNYDDVVDVKYRFVFQSNLIQKGETHVITINQHIRIINR